MASIYKQSNYLYDYISYNHTDTHNHLVYKKLLSNVCNV